MPPLDHRYLVEKRPGTLDGVRSGETGAGAGEGSVCWPPVVTDHGSLSTPVTETHSHTVHGDMLAERSVESKQSDIVSAVSAPSVPSPRAGAPASHSECRATIAFVGAATAHPGCNSESTGCHDYHTTDGRSTRISQRTVTTTTCKIYCFTQLHTTQWLSQHYDKTKKTLIRQITQNLKTRSVYTKYY